MSNYTLPPWMAGGPTNFGDSIGRGLQYGSTFAANRRESALMPLRRAVMENQIKSTSIDIETAFLQQQDYLSNKQAFSELSRAAAEISQGAAWSKPESERAIWDIAAKHPSVVATPQFKQIIGQFDVAGAAAIKARDADTRAIRAETDA